MATVANLANEEKLGLGLAAAAHVALFAFLALHDPAPADLPAPQRMEVSLAEEVSLTSTAPDPVREQQASVAPELAPVAAPPPQPAPQPVQERVQPRPQPTREAVQPAPRPTARPSPRQTARATQPPAPRPAASAPARPTTRATPTPAARPGGSRLGSDFLAGAGAGERTQAQGTVASAFGPAQQASLEQAINRQLKPHWSAPSGVDAELLVTVLAWELNADGSLKGRPTVVSQSGINDSNQPQASLHAERAIRAVQLAAPFALPEEFYDKWRRIRTWRFDRRL
jgi:outer membrane biosynthesis protein TonB